MVLPSPIFLQISPSNPMNSEPSHPRAGAGADHVFREPGPRPEGRGAGKHQHLAGHAVLAAQLFDGAGGELAHGLQQWGQVGHRSAKRS